jgi:ABC-type glutathione transport system ATPase component
VGLDPAAAHRACHEFSGGQKQRLVIARALSLKPKLLILDESLSGIDPETREGILELLRTLKEQLGITQLLISHDLELVSAFADSIALMHDGRIVEHQNSATVFKDREHWLAEHVHSVPRRDLVLTEAE